MLRIQRRERCTTTRQPVRSSNGRPGHAFHVDQANDCGVVRMQAASGATRAKVPPIGGEGERSPDGSTRGRAAPRARMRRHSVRHPSHRARSPRDTAISDAVGDAYTQATLDANILRTTINAGKRCEREDRRRRRLRHEPSSSSRPSETPRRAQKPHRLRHDRRGRRLRAQQPTRMRCNDRAHRLKYVFGCRVACAGQHTHTHMAGLEPTGTRPGLTARATPSCRLLPEPFHNKGRSDLLKSGNWPKWAILTVVWPSLCMRESWIRSVRLSPLQDTSPNRGTPRRDGECDKRVQQGGGEASSRPDDTSSRVPCHPHYLPHNRNHTNTGGEAYT